jgi:hypothetical protein
MRRFPQRSDGCCYLVGGLRRGRFQQLLQFGYTCPGKRKTILYVLVRSWKLP